jgi:hypothetical protein
MQLLAGWPVVAVKLCPNDNNQRLQISSSATWIHAPHVTWLRNIASQSLHSLTQSPIFVLTILSLSLSLWR